MENIVPPVVDVVVPSVFDDAGDRKRKRKADSKEVELEMKPHGFLVEDRVFKEEARFEKLEIDWDTLDSDSDSDDSQNPNKKRKKVASTKTVNAASEGSSNGSTGVGVKTLHIVSAVLASCSPFFYNLFKNGMKESQERNVTLIIHPSEERAFMDLLNFMYTDKLSASSAPDLLGVLMLADKYEVSSCMSRCSKLLEEMPMSLESALLYLEIPSSLLVGEVVLSRIDEAKNYLHSRYQYMFNGAAAGQEEALGLPLAAIEFILGSEFSIRSEEDVYEFIMKWGHARYPRRKERQKAVTDLISRFVHFPYLGMSTLKKIQESPEFDSKKISNLIIESLYMNAGYPYGERYRVPGAIGLRFRRDYDELPIKETEFGSCQVIYLNLESDLCGQHLDEEGRYSRVFFLGGQSFKFWVDACSEEGKESYLGLFLERVEGENGVCTFDYELEVQRFSAFCEGIEFERVYKFENCSLSVGKRVGSANLFGVPWKDLVKKKEYYCDDVLYFRAQFTIKYSHPIG